MHGLYGFTGVEAIRRATKVSLTWRAYLDKAAELTLASVEHTVFCTKYDDVLMAALRALQGRGVYV